MNWKESFETRFGINTRDFWRSAVMLISAGMILWLGIDSISHVREAYDGLCPDVQGAGLSILRYDGNPLGYCTGIGEYLSLLSLIMWIAALAVPGALAGLWYYLDRSRPRNSG